MSSNRGGARSAESRPKIKDVARLAGVGVGTVSRVVNQSPNVSPASIAAVEKAIAELGYRRNESARVLRTGATESIALLVEDVADPFFSLLNSAVEDEVIRRGSVLLTASSHKDRDRARDLILTFCARRVDGLVLTLPEHGDEDLLMKERDSGIPMVFVDRPPTRMAADVVLADNRGGAEAGVRHLIAHGHRRIACITDRAELFTATERLLGYRQALDAAGLPFDPALVFSAAPDPRDVGSALHRMCELDQPPTAVFAGNNRTCVHVISALYARGARQAVVGFDDFELADLMVPGITVIAQDPRLMGRTAMEFLLARLDGADRPFERVVLDTRLIARGSGEVSASEVVAASAS